MCRRITMKNILNEDQIKILNKTRLLMLDKIKQLKDEYFLKIKNKKTEFIPIKKWCFFQTNKDFNLLSLNFGNLVIIDNFVFEINEKELSFSNFPDPENNFPFTDGIVSNKSLAINILMDYLKNKKQTLILELDKNQIIKNLDI